MSNLVIPASITGLVDGQTVTSAHMKDLAAAVESWANGDIGDPNITDDPAQKIARAKLALTGAIVDSDIVSISASKISTLQATAQSTPGNTLAVAAGNYLSLDAKKLKTYAGGNSPAFANPSGGGLARIDILTISDSGTLAITQGIEGASPATPDHPADLIPIAEVYVRFNAGGVTIRATDNGTDSYIKADSRPLISNPFLADDSVTRAKLANGGASGAWVATGVSDLSDPGTSLVDMTGMAITNIVAAGSGSFDSFNRLLVGFDAVIELKQAGSAGDNLPMATLVLLINGNGGGFVEVKRVAVDLRNLALTTASGIGTAPMLFPVHLSTLVNPGTYTTISFKVQWARTNGASAGIPTIRQPGATYPRTLSALWLNKPALA